MLFATTLPLFCLVLQAFCNPLGEKSGGETRVQFGDVPEESYPSIVFLFARKRSSDRSGKACGATLITKRHLLTAAHCYQPDYQSFRAVFGSRYKYEPDNAGADAIEFGNSDWKVNPDYDPNDAFKNDNAIITLPREVKDSAMIQPIPLSLRAYNNSVRVVGWGKMDCQGHSSNYYLRAKGWIVDDETCRAIYKEGNVRGPIYSDQVCAQFRNNQGQLSGSDGGDSGGPLYAKTDDGQEVQIGVVSNSFKRFRDTPQQCTDPTFPMIYNKIAAPESMAFIKKEAPGARFI